MAAPAPVAGFQTVLSQPDRKHRLAKTAKRCFKSHCQWCPTSPPPVVLYRHSYARTGAPY